MSLGGNEHTPRKLKKFPATNTVRGNEKIPNEAIFDGDQRQSITK
jgi:hypothetical protein